MNQDDDIFLEELESFKRYWKWTNFLIYINNLYHFISILNIF